MKVFVLLILLTVTQVFASGVYSQNARLSINLSGTTVAQVLDEIQANSEFDFFYNNKLIDVERIVDINVDEEDIYAILGELFDQTDVEYVVKDKHIILSNQLPDEIESSVQGLTIKGKVSTTSNESLPGVTVVVKGTTNGTITDIDGNYILNDLPENSILIFSFVGFKTQEVAASRERINVILEEDYIGLEEVVAIGYGSIKKADVTSAVSSVKSENFVKGSVKDIGQLIQGKVAGLTISSSSGDPTSGTQIQLRGNTTIYGTSGNPLILVDGVPSDFKTVAAEDIETIDVLKDGSAAAIYGTRGTNGVIIITTKRASGKYKSSVEYSGYMSTEKIARQLDMLTADDYRQQIADGTRLASDDLGASTDWMDEITRTPFSEVQNLTFRGGNETTNYLATVNYRDQQGIFKKSNNNTLTARTDVNHSMFDQMLNFNLGILSRYNKYNTTRDRGSFDGYTYRQAIIYNPTSPVKDEAGNWTEQPGAFNYDNPLARIEECDGENSSQFSRVNGTVSLKPFAGLVMKTLVSYSKYNDTKGYYETKNHISTIRAGLNGYASNEAVESIDRLLEFTTEYSKEIGSHYIKVLGGYSYQANSWRNFSMTNQDFPTDLFGYNNIGLGTGIKEGGISSGIGSYKRETNLIGFFGRLNYNFNNRYLLMASLRHEAASQLIGTNNPWGTFPAVSVGWRLSEEEFMKSAKWIDDLKFRAGYGVTGTQPNDLFLGVATIGYGGNFFSNGKWTQTLAPTRNPNPYLRWEEKQETNIGVDFSLLSSRISGNIDYYNRTINGLLYDYQVPTPPNLVNTTRANVGKMENKGLEAMLNFVPVRNSDLEWNSSFNFSTNANKLISLSNDLYEATSEYFTTGGTGEPIQTFTHRVDVGDKIGNFYGFKVIDIDEDGKWIYEDKEGNAVPYAEFKHAFEDKQVLGNGLPKFYAGWNNMLRYKNFDLAITMRGAFGYQILNFERMYLENTKTVQYNRLRSAYDLVFDKVVLSDKMDLEYNSYYIENGDHWKIDNITFGFTIPFTSTYIKSMRVYASSLNTFVFTNYKGIDPEVSRAGLDPGNDGRDKFPTTRSFTLGLNLNF
ncbi:MAG: SusC/RagA family TonB-linked outer membrane protein [Prolixibacteraceae bacterium]